MFLADNGISGDIRRTIMIKSKINPILTLDYILKEDENKYFDRKSAQVKPSDIASLISAFANAEGGTIVIGISDKTRRIEGINQFGSEKINSFISAAKDYCQPMPVSEEEYLDVMNNAGEWDRILLLHIHTSENQIVKTNNGSVYLRMGDRTKEIKGEDYRSLEYNKSLRNFEDEINPNASLDDMDHDLLRKYRELIEAADLSDEQVLRARGLMREEGGKAYLTNAAVLLFAQNIPQFYPNCRIRFIRYDGDSAGVGENINVVKDVSIELPVLKIIDKAKEFISMQLRDFTALNKKTGKFEVVPEYPEFAWLEGITNAVTHREYAMAGSYIKVSMFDNRLEIESPGSLPNIVTLENILETRYSRNPKMSRVLTEFGYVRELNEGVKRIYTDMESLFLDAPEYSEPGGHSVRLVLRNNIVMRTIRQQEKTQRNIKDEVWNGLDDLEKDILIYMGAHQSVKTAELAEALGKATRTIGKRLNHLIELGIIKRDGNKNDPKQSYKFIQ